MNIPYKIEGIDLSPAILSKNHKPTRELVFAEVNRGSHVAKSLRTKDFKAITVRYGIVVKNLLFDLNIDPLEQNDIYDEKSESQMEFFRTIDYIIRQAKKFKPKNTDVDEKTIEQLRSLGYIK